MAKEIIIIALVILVIYLYYRQKDWDTQINEIGEKVKKTNSAREEVLAEVKFYQKELERFLEIKLVYEQKIKDLENALINLAKATKSCWAKKKTSQNEQLADFFDDLLNRRNVNALRAENQIYRESFERISSKLKPSEKSPTQESSESTEPKEKPKSDDPRVNFANKFLKKDKDKKNNK